MATDGIPDVYAKLREFGEVANETIDRLARTPPEVPESLVGRFLRLTGFRASDDQADLIQGLLEALCFHWVSSAGPEMKHGVWDHFKGGIYLSDGLGISADTGELEVEYISLLHGTRHHRRCSQWNEVVQWPDYKYRSRFVYRGPTLETLAPIFKVGVK